MWHTLKVIWGYVRTPYATLQPSRKDNNPTKTAMMVMMVMTMMIIHGTFCGKIVQQWPLYSAGCDYGADVVGWRIPAFYWGNYCSSVM